MTTRIIAQFVDKSVSLLVMRFDHGEYVFSAFKVDADGEPDTSTELAYLATGRNGVPAVAAFNAFKAARRLLVLPGVTALAKRMGAAAQTGDAMTAGHIVDRLRFAFRATYSECLALAQFASPGLTAGDFETLMQAADAA